MSEVKFTTLKVFDSLDVAQKCQAKLAELSETYVASNGVYFPVWLEEQSKNCVLSDWLAKQGAERGEKVLIYWNW